MKQKPYKKKRIKFIKKGLRIQILVWSCILGGMSLIGGTFAWYQRVMREAESVTAKVMPPYYLTLLNPSETALLEMSVGSLMPGQVKQQVFCVSNKDNEENEQLDMGGADFDYSMELIFTENLALNYEIYKLEPAEETTGTIMVEDVVESENGTETKVTYWNKVGEALKRTDVSTTRHNEILSGDTSNILNRGKYFSYEKTQTIDNGLHLSSGTGEKDYDSQYFVLEIEWKTEETTNFDKYEKETDMIYILVKALQPEPMKKTS